MRFKKFRPAAAFIIMLGAVVLSVPTLLSWSFHYGAPIVSGQFPVTVNPQHKTIVENVLVNAFLESKQSPFQAAVANTGAAFWNVFEWTATTISGAPWYQSIAGVAGIHNRLVTITPGMRKEQVANAFADALAWNNSQKQEFMTAAASATLPLAEGSFVPGVYTVTRGTTPAAAQTLVNKRFSEEILSHYGTTTAQIVSVNQALTVASLIEREAGGSDDMRMISGIIWNRLFANMNLQIDATVQYVKANSASATSWWPKVVPADMSRKSSYNTYLHKGLPPTPIANPSVAAVLAALNPRDTSCMFYFHDNAGQFHCSDTYAEHVALLKKYFGR
ncbi:MAG: endolytic transglycosylase MltG, partial [Candidatus Kaiserbacteria bacterium]|nr:endolytic transglycosylase MltG [Candidatus Kaiserbacteria bacterium]